MNSELIIYELLHSVLIKIRYESHEMNSPVVFHLSDLFHNIPLELMRSKREEDYDE